MAFFPSTHHRYCQLKILRHFMKYKIHKTYAKCFQNKSVAASGLLWWDLNISSCIMSIRYRNIFWVLILSVMLPNRVVRSIKIVLCKYPTGPFTSIQTRYLQKHLGLKRSRLKLNWLCVFQWRVSWQMIWKRWRKWQSYSKLFRRHPTLLSWDSLL